MESIREGGGAKGGGQGHRTTLSAPFPAVLISLPEERTRFQKRRGKREYVVNTRNETRGSRWAQPGKGPPPKSLESLPSLIEKIGGRKSWLRIAGISGRLQQRRRPPERPDSSLEEFPTGGALEIHRSVHTRQVCNACWKCQGFIKREGETGDSKKYHAKPRSPEGGGKREKRHQGKGGSTKST